MGFIGWVLIVVGALFGLIFSWLIGLLILALGVIMVSTSRNRRRERERQEALLEEIRRQNDLLTRSIGAQHEQPRTSQVNDRQWRAQR